ncbi:MAG: helix-turn-helix transcriptional regulator [Oscillospiraceae bacterium]|nr:helix-turn-helix transcriptional regulator [Oscillospiraceae bacterium]
MNNQTLGTMIATLRKEHNMTQLQLAEKMGVTDKAVSKWERDLSCPDVDSLPRLAEIFGITVDEMLRAKEIPAPQPKEDKMGKIMDIALKAIPLAMGVAVTVSAMLRNIDIYSGFSMLGIGLACIGIRGLENKE